MKAGDVKITKTQFLQDKIARRFADVVEDERIDFPAWLKFFNTPRIQQRMMDSEIHHDRPALAGVIKELEHTPAFESYLSEHDAHTTARGRQAVGVLTYMVMEALGWKRTGTKGSLGQRKSVKPSSKEPGAYHNRSGISKWFTKAERYEPPKGYPYRN